MNIIILNFVLNLLFLLFLTSFVKMNNISYNTIRNINCTTIRNITLRTIVFKEKRLPKFIKEVIKPFLENCYDRVYSSSVLSISHYNNLSEDDKTIIESIISLCY